jgi:acetylornithine deacetylase/succinyl-diaminopimelate desuccinylase-like protein
MAEVRIDPELVERCIFELAQHGAHGETGVWRTVYSPDWVAAQELVSSWFAAAGMDVRTDAVGNLFGRLEGTEPGRVIASGSHIDSQTPGGRYDGALGVIASFVAMRALREQFGRPRRTLEAVSLCEEEASRFHATRFWGSRAITARIAPDEPDPMAGAAEMILGVIGIALELGRPAVTTVGKLGVEPNLAPAVPEKVTFTVDTRHPDPALIQHLHARQEELMRSVAERRGLGISWTIPLDLPPCVCDPGVVALLENVARSRQIPFITMHSGAGHDTQNMAAVAKVAMIFVQSEGGRSHTPAEFTRVEHAVEGIRVLAAALHELAY